MGGHMTERVRRRKEIPATAAAPRSICVPRPARWECRADIVVADDCGRELLAKLANISEGGFMAECEEKLPKGAIVEVELPDRGRVRAEVRWVLGWRFGAMILPASESGD